MSWPQAVSLLLWPADLERHAARLKDEQALERDRWLELEGPRRTSGSTLFYFFWGRLKPKELPSLAQCLRLSSLEQIVPSHEERQNLPHSEGAGNPAPKHSRLMFKERRNPPQSKITGSDLILIFCMRQIIRWKSTWKWFGKKKILWDWVR